MPIISQNNRGRWHKSLTKDKNSPEVGLTGGSRCLRPILVHLDFSLLQGCRHMHRLWTWRKEHHIPSIAWSDSVGPHGGATLLKAPLTEQSTDGPCPASKMRFPWGPVHDLFLLTEMSEVSLAISKHVCKSKGWEQGLQIHLCLCREPRYTGVRVFMYSTWHRAALVTLYCKLLVELKLICVWACSRLLNWKLIMIW